MQYYGNEKIEDERIDELNNIEEEGDYVYHGTKANRDLIIEEGFNTKTVYFSDGPYLSLGYGDKLIKIKDINKYLKIKEVNAEDFSLSDEKRIEKFAEFDGIKHKASKWAPYVYQIFNVKKLNKLQKYKSDLLKI